MWVIDLIISSVKEMSEAREEEEEKERFLCRFMTVFEYVTHNNSYRGEHPMKFIYQV